VKVAPGARKVARGPRNAGVLRANWSHGTMIRSRGAAGHGGSGTSPRRKGECYVLWEDQPCLFRGAHRGGVARGRLRPRGCRRERPQEPVALDDGAMDQRRPGSLAVRGDAGLRGWELDQARSGDRSQWRHGSPARQSHGNGLPGLRRPGFGDRSRRSRRKPLRSFPPSPSGDGGNSLPVPALL
jgi:hypothetical protein